MSDHEMRVNAECGACRGTGVYVGLAERDGSSVQCGKCAGTGQRELVFKWSDFEGRKRRPGVTHVVQVNPGIVIGRGANNEYAQGDFGGMDYDAWFSGESFPAGSEMRGFTCPAWWYQSADYTKKPNWKECGWGTFSSCKHFPNKSACWSRWDREQAANVPTESAV